MWKNRVRGGLLQLQLWLQWHATSGFQSQASIRHITPQSSQKWDHYVPQLWDSDAAATTWNATAAEWINTIENETIKTNQIKRPHRVGKVTRRDGLAIYVSSHCLYRKQQDSASNWTWEIPPHAGIASHFTSSVQQAEWSPLGKWDVKQLCSAFQWGTWYFLVSACMLRRKGQLLT